MEYDVQVPVEAVKRFIGFTSTLGKELLDLGAANDGTVAKFLAITDPEYVFEWQNPSSALPQAVAYTKQHYGSHSDRSYLVMLLDNKLYEYSTPQEMQKLIRVLTSAVRFLAEIVTKDDLYVIFPADMHLGEVLNPLSSEGYNVFVLPHTVHDLMFDPSKRWYCSSLLQQYVAHRYMLFLHRRKGMTKSLQHYRMSNIFELLTLSSKPPGDVSRAYRLMSSAPEVKVAEMVDQLGKLTVIEKKRLTRPQKHNIMEVIRRFQQLSVGKGNYVTTNQIATLLHIQRDGSAVSEVSGRPIPVRVSSPQSAAQSALLPVPELPRPPGWTETVRWSTSTATTSRRLRRQRRREHARMERGQGAQAEGGQARLLDQGARDLRHPQRQADSGPDQGGGCDPEPGVGHGQEGRPQPARPQEPEELAGRPAADGLLDGQQPTAEDVRAEGPAAQGEPAAGSS